MTRYEDLTAGELRDELDDWTRRSLQWADDLANAIEAGDFIRAALFVTAYRQSRLQMRKLRRILTVEAA